MTNPEPVRTRVPRPGLALRMAFVLSLAILPPGLISVYQTYKVIEDRQRLSGTALLERTQQAASASRSLIRLATSAARTLSVTMSVVRDTPVTCDAVLARVVDVFPEVLFAGYVEEGLTVTCTSDGRRELGGLEMIETELAVREPGLFVRPLEFLAGRSTLTVTAPVTDEGGFLGTVLISVPLTELNATLSRAAPDVDLMLFRPDGTVIATEEFTDDRFDILPLGQTLQTLASQGAHTFRGPNRASETRDFAVTSIVDAAVFVLGSWEPRSAGSDTPPYSQFIALYFPIAMWAIAILVGYIGMHRLVIRHVGRLHFWMRRFSQGHIDFSEVRLDRAPAELEAVAEAFRAMTQRLGEHVRRQQEDLAEKTVLLREVHHRVKNNLQLISSMMNMQIRATTNPGARYLLRRIQDRIMALSMIHRNLYMARKLSRVRVDALLDDIIQQQVTVGTLDEIGHRIRLSSQLDPVEISPDQSVPLSLLAAEAVINAVKHGDVDKDVSGAWIDIALKEVEPGVVSFSVVNSRVEGAEDSDPDDRDGSGLGARLIETFVAQLGGSMERVAKSDRFELHVTFPVTWPDHSEDDT